MAKVDIDASEFFTDADELFALNKPVKKEVSLPELRKSEDEPVKKVIAQSMSGPEKIALDARRWDPTKAAGDPERFRAKWFEEERPFELVASSIVRPDGTRLFTAASVKQLKGLNPKTWTRLLTAAQEVNGEDVADLRLSGKAGSLVLNGDNGSGSHIPTEPALSDAS